MDFITLYKRKNKGFTVIELLVVVAIVAILFSIITAMVLSYRKKSTNTATVVLLKEFRVWQDLYYAKHGHYLHFDCGASNCRLCENITNPETNWPPLALVADDLNPFRGGVGVKSPWNGCIYIQDQEEPEPQYYEIWLGTYYMGVDAQLDLNEALGSIFNISGAPDEEFPCENYDDNINHCYILHQAQ